MKIRLILICMSVLYAFLLTALFKMQILDYSLYKEKSERNRIRPSLLEAPRGLIFDRNGAELARNRLSFDCYILPMDETDRSRLFGQLSAFTDTKASLLEQAYKKNRYGRYSPVLVAEDIGRKRAIRIEEASDRLNGAFIKTRPVREYPAGEASAHVTGYVGAINADEFGRMRQLGYLRNDKVGRSGVERQYDSYLRGKHGYLQFEVDSRGRLLRVLSIKDRKEGRRLELTIDRELQSFIYKELEGRRGAVGVMELHTGGLLALVSSPSFDPNIFASPAQHASDIRSVLRDVKQKPMTNRAIAGAYPPGSTFKVVSALAGLAAGSIASDTNYFCPGKFTLGGYTFRCWRKSGHGGQNVVQAIQHSCNVFFYSLANRMGVKQLEKFAHKFGLGERTGVDLPGESEGLVPGPAWKRKARGEKWYAGETLIFAIGQGSLNTTPLQMLKTTAAVATGGQLFQPYLLKKIDRIDMSPHKRDSFEIDAYHLNLVHKGMREVVQSTTGTGQKAHSDEVAVSGKTGTAQATGGDDHAWFIGFAPSDNPQAAIVVFVEHGGKGSHHSARIAGNTFKWMSENGMFVQ